MSAILILSALIQTQTGADQTSSAPPPTPIVFIAAEGRRANRKAVSAIAAGETPEGWRIVRKPGSLYAVSESLPEIQRAKRALLVLDALAPSLKTGTPVRVQTLPIANQRALASAMSEYTVGVIKEDGTFRGDPALALAPTITLTFAGEGRTGTVNVLGATGGWRGPEKKAQTADLIAHPLVWDMDQAKREATAKGEDYDGGGWQIWFSNIRASSPLSRGAREKAIEIAYEVVDEITDESEKAMKDRVMEMMSTWPEGRATMDLELGAGIAGLPKTMASTVEGRLFGDRRPRDMSPEQAQEWSRHVTLQVRRFGFDVRWAGPGEGAGTGSAPVWP